MTEDPEANSSTFSNVSGAHSSSVTHVDIRSNKCTVSAIPNKQKQLQGGFFHL